MWFRDTTKADVAFALEVAETPAEVDAAAWVSLLRFDVAGCNAPFVDDRGRGWPSLHTLVCVARSRVHGYPDSTYELAALHDALSAAAKERRIAEARATRAERDERIRRIGMNSAFPEVRRPTHR